MVCLWRARHCLEASLRDSPGERALSSLAPRSLISRAALCSPGMRCAALVSHLRPRRCSRLSTLHPPARSGARGARRTRLRRRLRPAWSRQRRGRRVSIPSSESFRDRGPRTATRPRCKRGSGLKHPTQARCSICTSIPLARAVTR